VATAIRSSGARFDQRAQGSGAGGARAVLLKRRSGPREAGGVHHVGRVIVGPERAPGHRLDLRPQAAVAPLHGAADQLQLEQLQLEQLLDYRLTGAWAVLLSGRAWAQA
jgi:hypothetical protein